MAPNLEHDDSQRLPASQETCDESPLSTPGESRSAADRFRRRHQLGQGGQGEVWLAFDPKLERYVALKEIKPGLRGSKATVSHFRNEARLTGELEHPNIVTVYEAEHVLEITGSSEAGAAASGSAQSTAVAGSSGAAPFYVMRVFGNRNLMKAFAEFYARERTPTDYPLLDALENVQKQATVEHQQQLRVALEQFPFDEQQPCDVRLRKAVEGYLDDPKSLDGRSLHDAIRELHAVPWSPDSERTLRDLLRRFIHVCDALAYAHSRGLIHRDLKPQNIMLGGFGETLVVDWGLAKVVGRDELHADGGEGTVSSARGASETMLGSIKGTPSWMPPEQARGEVTSLGPKSDIYSLGAILYALLTGRPPVTGRTAPEILERVRSGRFEKPTSLNPQAPKALEAVALKALEKEPLDRYGTAQELAADVARWLDDEPVTAWPEPFTLRARRWVRRHPALVSSTAAAVLVATVSLSLLVAIVTGKNEQLTESNNREKTAREQAEQNETRALAGEELARNNADEARNNADEARKNADEARRNAEVATAQSGLALSTLNSVIFDLNRSLKNVPGGAEVRQRLLSSVLPQLEKVSTEFASKSAVDRNTMAALIDLADTVLQLGTVGWAPGPSVTPESAAATSASPAPESVDGLDGLGALSFYQIFRVLRRRSRRASVAASSSHATG